MYSDVLYETNTSNELFSEFKFHLLHRNKPTKQRPIATQNFKQLLTDITISKQNKQQIKNRLVNLKQKLVDQPKRQKLLLSIRQNRYSRKVFKNGQQIRPKTSCNYRGEQTDMTTNITNTIEQQILLTTFQGQKLMEEISRQQNSYDRLKKSLRNIHQQLDKHGQVEQKYKNIQYLTRSIDQQTEAIRLNNQKDYQGMVSRQQLALNHLHSYNTDLKREKQQLVEVYADLQQKTIGNKLRKIHKESLSAQGKPTIKKQIKNIKQYQQFFNHLTQILELIARQSPYFETIKQQYSNKQQLSPVIKDYLSNSRVQFHQALDLFHDQNNLIIEVIPNILLKFYHQLTLQNQQLQKQCLKKNTYRQILIQDNHYLSSDTSSTTIIPILISSKSVPIVKTNNIYKSMIRSHSQLFIRLLLLLKILTNKLHPIIEQLQSSHLFTNNQTFFNISTLTNSTNIFSQSQHQYNFINRQQLITLLNQKIPSSSTEIIELVQYIINDNRNLLIIKRCWIQQQSNNNIVEIVQEILTRCQKIFDRQMNLMFRTIIDTFNQLKCILPKDHAQTKLPQNYSVKTYIGRTGPNSALPIRHNSCDSEYDDSSIHQRQLFQKPSQLTNQLGNQQLNQQQYFQKDARRVIATLTALKNNQKKYHKYLDIEQSQQYMYETKIPVPRYRSMRR